MEITKTYTPAECIGHWDREIKDQNMDRLRALILPLEPDDFNYAGQIGKWEE